MKDGILPAGGVSSSRAASRWDDDEPRPLAEGAWFGSPEAEPASALTSTPSWIDVTVRVASSSSDDEVSGRSSEPSWTEPSSRTGPGGCCRL